MVLSDPLAHCSLPDHNLPEVSSDWGWYCFPRQTREAAGAAIGKLDRPTPDPLRYFGEHFSQ